MTFDGTALTATETERLMTAVKGIEAIMQEGQWWSTLRLQAELRKRYGLSVSESTVTAKIRDLRKDGFGAYTIEAKRTDAKISSRSQVWIYKMVLGGQA